MRVVISGMSGFIGSHLAAALEARGHEAVGCSVRVGDPVDARLFEGADAFVHCAHDFRPGALERNVAGSRLFFEAVRGCYRVFVSSHSARADAVAEYGISKYRIEQFWLAEGGTVVRPGLVLGNGGVFGRSLDMMRRWRVIPLVDGGRDPVAVISIDALTDALVGLIEARRAGAWNLFEEAMPTMRELVASRVNGLVIPIPYRVAMAAVRYLKLPFNAGSLETLRLNRRPVHQSDLRALTENGQG